MKQLTLVFFFSLFVFSCKSGDKEGEMAMEKSDTAEMERTYLANAHLFGNIKSYEETPFTVDENSNTGEMDSCCVKINEINEQGFMNKKTEKNKAGAISEIAIIEHSETGEFISSTVSENGKQMWKRVLNRNADGAVINAVDTDSSGLVIRIHVGENYNDFNQPVSGKSYAVDSTYLGTWTWKYIDGNRTGRTWVDDKDVQLVDRTGEVNEKGWLSKVIDIRVDENGDNVTSIETYTYDSFDEKGNWTQRTEYRDDKAVEVLKRSYTYW